MRDGLARLSFRLAKPGLSRKAFQWVESRKRAVWRSTEQVEKGQPMQNENIEPGYRVWGVDNIPYGPVGLPNLVSWIKEERVSADTWVFFERQHSWQKASQVPELKMFFQTPSPGLVGPPPGAGRGTAASHGIKP